ncbi:MAG: methyltransferase domain-containing protein [Gammaproteobacteria bacterium]|nr:methyltransferase domain-containing protein [Gammaproteobacteria bacterium]MCP5201568.1 methyltransferase domain-containing protein [Gammaproteobacteria bacterium]
MNTRSIDTTRLQRIARAYSETAVFYAALDLEVFTHIAHGVDTEPALAEAMGASALNTERLLTVLRAMGLVEHRDGRYANAPDAARYLVKGAPAYAAPWMTFTRGDVPGWFRLGEILRDSTPPSTLGMYADLTVESARAYHAATYSIGMGAGKRFCREVDLGGRKRLLDLGGGSGAYSINAVTRYPGLRAVVLDLPPVVEVTREYLLANGVADRVDTLAGDFTTTPLPTDCDVAVMASNLPIYNAETIRRVVRRVFDALPPGGEFHLVGEMLHADGNGPLDAALWGMYEAVCGSAGRAHSVSECRDYFADAGFGAISDAVFVAGTLHRVTGVKPA